MSETSAPAHPGFGDKAYRAYVLGALLVIYTLNFIDRILISIVQEPIRREFMLDDGVMGWLGGPTFAILYTLMGIPIARHAERSNRIGIIAIGAALWSAMTALCGFAGNFVQLALARVGVGIGEAACVPPSHSVISDYFPATRRATALAIFSLGVPIGTMFAALGGGWLAQHFDWRVSFWALGAPGLIAAVIFKLSVREPQRVGAATAAPSFSDALRLLGGKASFWHMATAAALMSFVGYGTVQFLVTYMVRAYALSIGEASLIFGLIAGLSAGLGTFLGGAIGDRLAIRHPRVLSWLPALCVAGALPLYLLGLMQTEIGAGIAFLILAPILHYAYLAPTFAVAHAIAPPRMRATTTALLVLIINLIGYGLGPPFVGMVADHFASQQLGANALSLEACRGVEDGLCAAARTSGLRISMMITVCVLAWASLHFYLAGRTLARDRVG
jgi:predicted MFS family arabinose efflux permease